MVLDNEATGVMADTLLIRLSEIEKRWGRITDQDIGEAQNAIEYLAETLKKALRVMETARSIPHHDDPCVIYSSTSPCDGCVEHKLLHDALTAFTQHTEQT